MKIAVNKCFGGWALSDSVFEFLINKGWKITKLDNDGQYEDESA